MKTIIELEREIESLKRSSFYQTIIIFVLLGVMSNFGVMMNNNGKMPVYFSNEEIERDFDRNKYLSFNDFDKVNFPYLADIIHIKGVGKYSGKYSIGDIIMLSSFSILVFHNILTIVKFVRKKFKTK